MKVYRAMMRTRACALALAVFCGLPRAGDAAESRLRMEPAWDYPILGAGLAAAASGLYVERRIASRSFDPYGYRREDIPAYDRWAIGFYSKPLASLSDFLIVADGLAPLAFTGLEVRGGNESLKEAWADLVLYGEVAAYASAISLYSKTSRLHPRPLAFTGEAPRSERESGDARSSFFSEHTTGAFAAAVFTGYVFQLGHPESPWMPWVWAGALGTASGVGALRVLSGKHFPSDVLAGAIAGAAVGYAVPRLHLRRAPKPESKAKDSGSSGFFRGLEMGAALHPADLSPMLLFTLHV
jgi:membrane-associated phospholipid phosphatase